MMALIAHSPIINTQICVPMQFSTITLFLIAAQSILNSVRYTVLCIKYFVLSLDIKKEAFEKSFQHTSDKIIKEKVE